MMKLKPASSYPFLTVEETRNRLKIYESEDVTNELLGFGKILMDEAADRINKLDTKAGVLAGYAIGIITLIAVTAHNWSTHVSKLFVPIPLYAGVVALIAAFFAINTFRVRKFKTFSQEDWLKADCLSDAKNLKKFRILLIQAAHTSVNLAAEKKTKSILISQWMLFVAAIILLISAFNLAGVY